MTADLTEFQESARKVLRDREVPAGEAKTWSLIVELGWLLMSVPEELGGLEQELAAPCVFYTELGRCLSGAPYLPAMLALDAVCAGGLADREGWVERMSAGEFVAVPLVDPELCVTVEAGGKHKLSGLASAVQSADSADHILIAAANLVALAPLAQAGMEVVARPTWDTTRRLFDVRFTNVDVDKALVLATGAAAADLVARLAVHRDFALAAEAVGGADALLDRTVDYLQTRQQYRRPLAMFQALKHRCADLKAQIAAAEALVLDSLDKLEEAAGPSDAALKGRMAKSFACAVFAKVAEEAVQLHGGIAVTSEHPCHLYLKRALLNQYLGRSGDSYDVDIADALLSA